MVKEQGPCHRHQVRCLVGGGNSRKSWCHVTTTGKALSVHCSQSSSLIVYLQIHNSRKYIYNLKINTYHTFVVTPNRKKKLSSLVPMLPAEMN